MAGNVTRCLLLGPLAVDESVRKRGVGAVLMWRALRAAKARGYRAVLLVGDPAYYSRFGFSACNTATSACPGPMTMIACWRASSCLMCSGARME